MKESSGILRSRSISTWALQDVVNRGGRMEFGNIGNSVGRSSATFMSAAVKVRVTLTGHGWADLSSSK
jgi:hypothetical protein